MLSPVLPLPVRFGSRYIPACAVPGIHPTAHCCGKLPRSEFLPPAFRPAHWPFPCPRRRPSGSPPVLQSPAQALPGPLYCRSPLPSGWPVLQWPSGSPSHPVSAQRTGSRCPVLQPCPQWCGLPSAGRFSSHPGWPALPAGSAHSAPHSSVSYALRRLRLCTAPPVLPAAGGYFSSTSRHFPCFRRFPVLYLYQQKSSGVHRPPRF